MIRKRMVLSALAAAVLLLTACGTSPIPTQEPECETFPGMPDRPCDPADTERSDYRPDTPEAVGATGRPQLLVFHRSVWPPGSSGMGCVACVTLRPTVQTLEAEYWERIDFVYLERTDPAAEPLLEQFGIASSANNPNLDLILVDASGEQVIRFYEGANLNRLGAEAQPIEFYRNLLDRQLEKLAAGG
jgi:hypothetical protein